MNSINSAYESLSVSDSLQMEPEGSDAIAGSLRRARSAQRAWRAFPVRDRLRILRRFRGILAMDAEVLCRSVSLPNRTPKDTIAAEILPLADACRYLERNTERILGPRRERYRNRPRRLGAVTVEVHREPRGVILIIGPRSYPLFLPGVQTLQALAAGNAVLWKPASGGFQIARRCARLLEEAGLPCDLLQILPEAPEAARTAIRGGVDLVVLTGSTETGRLVLYQAAETLTPAVMELGGCDAVFVREDADIGLVVRALMFGLRFNGGATCIAPRRVFAARGCYSAVCRGLADAASELHSIVVESRVRSRVVGLARAALAGGARLLHGNLEAENGPGMTPIILADARPEMELLQSDLFAPVLCLVPVDDDDQALAAADMCPYALGAAVFGKREGAESLARHLNVGCVVVNDLIVPTADPRVPFAPRRRSGFGVTRGPEGLLEMTVVKSIATRERGPRRHLDPPGPQDLRIMRSLLEMSHGPTLGRRIRAGFRFAASVVRRLRGK
ncbi:MAG: aldehyde dehydrogenase [Thermogutta sp.]|nr:aldehyde dehydrogenase [Thermogutta sp.]